MTKYLIIIILLNISINLPAQDIPNLKEDNGKFALIGSDGKTRSDWYNAIFDFKFGIAIVRQNTLFGAIDKTGAVVIPVEFSAIEIKNKYSSYIENYIAQHPDNEEVKNYLADKKNNEEQQKAIQEQLLLDKLKEQADNYYSEREYEKAIESYKKYLEQKPDDANALYNLSRSYFRNKNYQQAYQIMKKLSLFYSRNSTYFYWLSWYALFAGQYQEAIDAAQKTHELDSEKTDVYSNLAPAYVLNNQFEKAKPIYLEWKDKHFPNDDRTCKEVFLNEIKALEEAGIKHKDFKKVKVLLEK